VIFILIGFTIWLLGFMCACNVIVHSPRFYDHKWTYLLMFLIWHIFLALVIGEALGRYLRDRPNDG